MNYKLVHDESRSRMEAMSKGKTIGLIDYKMTSVKIMTIYHTEVATIYEGQGIAAAMTEKLLSFARENSYKVKPLCPYVKFYLERHPNFQNIIYENDSQL